MMNSAATKAFDFPTSFCLRFMKNLSKIHVNSKTGIPKEELSVQVADVDGVHIYNVDILEPRQRKIRKDLAT